MVKNELDVAAVSFLRNHQSFGHAQVYYRVHNSLLVVPLLSQMNPVHVLPFYCFTIQINIIPPMLTRGANKSIADQEGNKLQRPNSEFIQHTPHEVL